MAQHPALSATPNVLYFPAPHDRHIHNTISVKNNSSESLAVKVKASEPSRYFVKPTSFLANPGQVVPLTVTFKMGATPPTNTRDVFLLEARVVAPGKVGSIREMWESLGASVAHLTLATNFTAAPPGEAKLAFPDNIGSPSHSAGGRSPVSAISSSPQSAAVRPTAATDAPISGRPASSAALGKPPVAPAATPAAASNTFPAAKSETIRLTQDVKEARDKHVTALAAVAELTNAAAAQDVTRDSVIEELRTAPTGCAFPLSLVVFCMLASYIGGMLLSRGWPTAPVA